VCEFVEYFLRRRKAARKEELPGLAKEFSNYRWIQLQAISQRMPLFEEVRTVFSTLSWCDVSLAGEIASLRTTILVAHQPPAIELLEKLRTTINRCHCPCGREIL
jgi:hypothetical protein